VVNKTNGPVVGNRQKPPGGSSDDRNGWAFVLSKEKHAKLQF